VKNQLVVAVAVAQQIVDVVVAKKNKYKPS